MSNHGAARYGGKLLLGQVTDSVLGALEMYSESAVELVNAHNRKRGTGEASSQDWAIIIIRSLEDSLLLPKVRPMRIGPSFPSRVYSQWTVYVPRVPLFHRAPSQRLKNVLDPDSLQVQATIPSVKRKLDFLDWHDIHCMVSTCFTRSFPCSLPWGF